MRGFQIQVIHLTVGLLEVLERFRVGDVLFTIIVLSTVQSLTFDFGFKILTLTCDLGKAPISIQKDYLKFFR